MINVGEKDLLIESYCDEKKNKSWVRIGTIKDRTELVL